MYERILVALDGSPAAERVLPHAEAFASAFGSHITLLRATISPEMIVALEGAGDASLGQVPPVLDPEPVVEADQETAEAYLERMATALRQRNVPVEVETSEGSATSVIVDRAVELNVGLIIMATRGRGGLARLVFGSTGDSVTRHAPCPVMLVRVDEPTASSSAEEEAPKA